MLLHPLTNFEIKTNKQKKWNKNGNKNIIANIFRVQANNLIMCGYFYIGFIDFVLAGKKLTDFTSMFSLYDFEKKWTYNFELFQRWVKLIKQNWLIRQNSD